MCGFIAFVLHSICMCVYNIVASVGVTNSHHFFVWGLKANGKTEFQKRVAAKAKNYIKEKQTIWFHQRKVKKKSNIKSYMNIDVCCWSGNIIMQRIKSSVWWKFRFDYSMKTTCKLLHISSISIWVVVDGVK